MLHGRHIVKQKKKKGERGSENRRKTGKSKNRAEGNRAALSVLDVEEWVQFCASASTTREPCEWPLSIFPLGALSSNLDGDGETARKYEHSSSTTLEVGGRFVCMRDDSVAVSGAGATASAACVKWLEHHNSRLRQLGILKVSTYPTTARFKFGDGRVREVRYAADIKIGFAGRGGAFRAFALEPDIRALLREGASEALGGQLDFVRNVLGIRNHGVDIPLK